MLPIILSKATRVGLAGHGEGLGRRASLLMDAGLRPVLVAPEASNAELSGLRLLFVAGLDNEAAAALARRARELGVLVNVEDVPELCDFHVPALVRRGDLLLTVSTGGRVPGLARQLRETLERQFGVEWSERLEALAEDRARWRAEGAPPADISTRTRERISREGWL